MNKSLYLGFAELVLAFTKCTFVLGMPATEAVQVNIMKAIR